MQRNYTSCCWSMSLPQHMWAWHRSVVVQTLAWGVHMVFRVKSSCRSTRHHLIWQALQRVYILATKEPKGLLRGDGKRPDGLSIVPWQGGWCLTWDATVVDTSRRLIFHLHCRSQAVQLRQQLRENFLNTPPSVKHTFLFQLLWRSCDQWWGLLWCRRSTLLGRIRWTVNFCLWWPQTFLFQQLSVLVQLFKYGCFPLLVHLGDGHHSLATPNLF